MNMQDKRALTVHEEPDFIFTMRMFGEELLAQFRQIGCGGVDPYDIRTACARLTHKGIKIRAVGSQHFIRRRILGGRNRCCPAFETDIVRAQCLRDFAGRRYVQKDRVGSIVPIDGQSLMVQRAF